MKNLLLLLILLFSYSCNCSQKSDNKKKSNESFDWLVGDWQRTNEEEDLTTFEYWKKISDTEYEGLGIRLQLADTLFQENIMLVKYDKTWNLSVMTKEDSIPTTFKVTKTDSASFTCENPDNEFPNKIRYFKEGDLLKAIISNEEMEIPFQFERIK